MRHAGLVFGMACAIACACSAPAAGPSAPISKLGAITVLARDHDSGEMVAHADLALRGPVTRALTSSKFGFATFDQLPPGTYDLVATFAAQPYEIDGVTVRANQTSYVDVAFTLGRPEPIKTRYGDGRSAAIDTYRPRGMNPTVARIEGTVSDSTTHERVAGAVVTAVRGTDVQQAVTDDQGRYRFDDLLPGSYAVSAYYNVEGRGQIEQRRSAIELAGGDAAIVPLVIELAH